MVVPKMKYQITIFLFFALITFLLAASSVTQKETPAKLSNQQCVECHAPLIKKDRSKTFIHNPFLENECTLCHIAGEKFSADKKSFMADRTVEWLSHRHVTSREHLFHLDKEQLDTVLLIDMQIPDNGTYHHEITVPTFTEMPEIALDKNPPTLSEVKVDNIEMGVLLSARINWHSDEIADSRVIFGDKILNLTEYCEEMCKDHHITLHGLKSDRDYKFKIRSTDYSGNTAESAIHTFSTFNYSPASRETISSEDETSKEELHWDKEVNKCTCGDMVVLKITSNIPTIVAVGVPAPSEKDLPRNIVIPNKERPFTHKLESTLKTSNLVCKPCHENYGERSTHPFNVGPMIIPPEYYDYGLANGNIPCMTCHAAHASDITNRLVKPTKKEQLCLSCHIDKKEQRIYGK